MDSFLKAFNHALDALNTVIWHNYVLYIVMGTGVLFTLWSVFCQYRALTHGVQVIRGVYDDKNDPGAINHFQALSAALSATVGLGNIGGVALAIALGGPGAVFWMWMIGLAGMALKTTEVTLSMIYRNTDDPDNPHGGPMFVAKKALAQAEREGRKGIGRATGIVFALVSIGAGALWHVAASPSTQASVIGFAVTGVLALVFLGLGFFKTAAVGAFVGGVFCVTLLVSTITGGNMFQAWNVADITHQYFQVPQVMTGIILAVLVGMVIIGGIKRIGAVAGRLVPVMCGMYLVAAIYVLLMNFSKIPDMFALIFREAFSPTDAQGAFLGGTAGYAFLWGMKRALFSSEAGQGSSPIAHSAAKTDEPVREAVVAGLEPFIDTLVVCTLTTMVILSSGVWNRGPDVKFATDASSIAAVKTDDGAWTLPPTPLDADSAADTLHEGLDVFTVIEAGKNRDTGLNLHRLEGSLRKQGDTWVVEWDTHEDDPSLAAVRLHQDGVFFDYKGASLTARAFDMTTPGLGMWLVSIAAWLFAVSTMISWSYYGEQGVVYLFGERFVLPYKLLYCVVIVVATVPSLIRSDAELDALTSLGTGVMLWANIPIMLVFGGVAMAAYHDYFRRYKRGEMTPPHEAPPITEVVEGHDVE